LAGVCIRSARLSDRNGAQTRDEKSGTDCDKWNDQHVAEEIQADASTEQHSGDGQQYAHTPTPIFNRNLIR
jgi:hypothetical protein